MGVPDYVGGRQPNMLHLQASGHPVPQLWAVVG